MSNIKQMYILMTASCLLLIFSNPAVCFAKSQNRLASDSNAARIDGDGENMELLAQEIIYYYDPEPLTADVYVRSAPFSVSSYDYPLWRNLSPRNNGREILEDVYINWNQEEYNKGIESGALEFDVRGSFLPVLLDEADEDLWNKGLLQFETSSTPKMTVHVRPPDFITTYFPARSEELVRTLNKDTPFEDSLLTADMEFLPVDSPYDTSIWLNVIWNQEQYEAGMASGAARFTISGTYSISKIMTGEYPEYWDKGLLNISPEPKLTIELYGKPSKPIMYYDSYAADTRTYHTVIRPESSFDEMPKPKSETLNLRDGEWWDTRDFQIIWNEEEYQTGMKSDASSFELSGIYGPGLLEDNEKEWWDDGLIAIEPESAPKKLRVHVTRESEIPFTISFRSDCPLFVFPSPQGATKVICEFSLDGTNWYQEECTDNYADTFAEYAELWVYLYDGQDELITVPQDKPSYYRMRIYGSAYEGVTKILTVNDGEGTEPDDNGDIDGNRGGGGQGESTRPNGPSQSGLDQMTGPGVPNTDDGAIQGGADSIADSPYNSHNGNLPQKLPDALDIVRTGNPRTGKKGQHSDTFEDVPIPAAKTDDAEAFNYKAEESNDSGTVAEDKEDTDPSASHQNWEIEDQSITSVTPERSDGFTKKSVFRHTVAMGLSAFLVLFSMAVFYFIPRWRSEFPGK